MANPREGKKKKSKKTKPQPQIVKEVFVSKIGCSDGCTSCIANWSNGWSEESTPDPRSLEDEFFSDDDEESD